MDHVIQSVSAVTPLEIEINDGEKVRVDPSYHGHFYFRDVEPVNEAAFKCAGCKIVTVHGGVQIQVGKVFEEPTVACRIYVCYHCGNVCKK